MTVSISGTVYTDEGITTMGSGRTLNVSINGAASSGSTTTASDGTYTISGLTVVAADVIIVYLQGNTEKAVTVSRGTGSNMTGFDLYQNDLITRSDDGFPLTTANLATAATNAATGISAVYSLNVGDLVTASGKGLYVPAGHTYSPTTGNITAGSNVTMAGTFISTNTSISTAGNMTLKTGGNTFSSLLINGSNVVTLGSDITLTGGISFVSGTATLDVSSSNYTITLAGNWTMATSSGSFVKRNGTVTFNSPSVRTINAGNVLNKSFYNLVHSGAGTIQVITNSLTVTHALTNSNGTIDLNGKNLIASGATFSNSGTLQLQGGETLTGFTNDTANGGNVTYVGTGTTTYTSLNAGNTYKHLTFNGSGRKWQPAADATISGNMTITAGTLDMSNANKNLTVGGNLSNSGTFTAGTGTVTLNGTNQTITGSTTFYNLTKTTAGTLTFTDATTQTVSHAVDFEGCTLAGSSTGGWTIAMPATQTLTGLLVSYSTATGNTAVTTTSTDGGHNTNWSFGAASQEVDPSGIASAEAFGTCGIAIELDPSGIGSAEAFGSCLLSLAVSPSGIASAEAFGTCSVMGAGRLAGVFAVAHQLTGTSRITHQLTGSASVSARLSGGFAIEV